MKDRSMRSNPRQIKLLHAVREHGDLSVEALAEMLGVTLQTVRRDVQGLALDPKTGKPKKPARATLHGEIVTLRQILKTANRKGWIAAIPDMSAPYKTSGKVEHRAWFSPEEYTMLYEATRERAQIYRRKQRHNSGGYVQNSLDHRVLLLVTDSAHQRAIIIKSGGCGSNNQNDNHT